MHEATQQVHADLMAKYSLTPAETDSVALRANPTGVVMESWKILDTAIREFAIKVLRLNIHLGLNLPIRQVLDKLLAAGAIV